MAPDFQPSVPSAVARAQTRPLTANERSQGDLSTSSRASEDLARPIMLARPKLSLTRLSSLDQLLEYHQELSAYAKSSDSMKTQDSSIYSSGSERRKSSNLSSLESGMFVEREVIWECSTFNQANSKFRSLTAEIAFCFSIAMTQLLSEVFISGFALVLVNLLKNTPEAGASSTGSFWPAAILSLVISATLLVWARIADMHGGYLPMMFGLLWLTIWSVIPGLSTSLVVLNIARAMQGLAISALMPSVFVLLGHIYEDGRRKNIVLGIYGACAPLGFYAGFIIGGLLPPERTSWFFLITAGLSLLTMVTSYLSIPRDGTDRCKLDLKMDWLGAFAIISGLILLNYALAAEPRQAQLNNSTTAFGDPAILLPFLTGILALIFAVWVEGWYATCPLLPFDFFRPRGVKMFCLACLFYYGTFGVWIYHTSEYLNIPAVIGDSSAITGTQLVLWYMPLVVCGILFSIVGSAITSWISLKTLLALSGLAWIVAPLVFAVAPLPLQYWYMVLPSMVCASLGIDLTFTISNMFLSASQPQKYQGVAGAVSSILFNLGVSFALPLAQIVYAAVDLHAREVHPPETTDAAVDAKIWAYRCTFLYAMASAVVGVLICILCFRPGAQRLLSEDVEAKSSRASSVSEATTPC